MHALKAYALSDEQASRNSDFKGFAETRAFLSVTTFAAGIVCFSSHRLVNRARLHLLCSRLDFLQVFQVKNPRNPSFCSNFQCPHLNSTGILLIFSSWLFKGNYPRFVSCFGFRLRAGKFAKRSALILQRLPQDHSSQQNTAANFSFDFQYLFGRTLPERLV
jgi:hypothetical protein